VDIVGCRSLLAGDLDPATEQRAWQTSRELFGAAANVELCPVSFGAPAYTYFTYSRQASLSCTVRRPLHLAHKRSCHTQDSLQPACMRKTQSLKRADNDQSLQRSGGVQNLTRNQGQGCLASSKSHDSGRQVGHAVTTMRCAVHCHWTLKM